ncbi:MAG: elongation factor Ts [Candidatus Pacebacteria bacterium]|nr:elongation factor Ts [Candidatus Paceibacterota bacterium]MBP9866493.1 elongation factor Ts [Candidatus Paceibacterota bacterium]
MDTIKELREETGLSLSQIKKALDEVGGDKEKARALLAEYSATQAEKKSDRELAAGVISAYVHSTGTIGVLLELGCETDFVAKNEEFVALAHDIAMHVCAMAPTSINNEDGLGEETALMKQSFIKNPELTIEQKIQSAVQKFGENTKVIRFSRYSISE